MGTKRSSAHFVPDKLCVGGADQCYKVSVMKDPPGRGKRGEERIITGHSDTCLPSYFY